MPDDATTTEQLEGVERAIEDPDPRRRLDAARRLVRLHPADGEQRSRAVVALGRLADDEADYVRWNVAMALGPLGDPAGLASLRRLAGDEHANVRLRVALGRGAHR